MPAREKPAGLHQLVTGLMDRRFLMVQSPNQGDAIHHHCQSREMLRYPHAGDTSLRDAERPPKLAWGIWLGIKRIELARTPDQE
jgi:hypothetical protein